MNGALFRLSYDFCAVEVKKGLLGGAGSPLDSVTGRSDLAYPF
jgi:hypothetical protein